MVELAGLKPLLASAVSADRTFAFNWSVIRKWKVEDRYTLDISLDEAKDLYGAISAKKSGMMALIRKHW